jgi:hypothetical protein
LPFRWLSRQCAGRRPASADKRGRIPAAASAAVAIPLRGLQAQQRRIRSGDATATLAPGATFTTGVVFAHVDVAAELNKRCIIH